MQLFHQMCIGWATTICSRLLRTLTFCTIWIFQLMVAFISYKPRWSLLTNQLIFCAQPQLFHLLIKKSWHLSICKGQPYRSVHRKYMYCCIDHLFSLSHSIHYHERLGCSAVDALTQATVISWALNGTLDAVIGLTCSHGKTYICA